MQTPLASPPERPDPAAPPSPRASEARPSRRTTPRWVRRSDALARWVISLGGVLVVVTVLGMMVFILSEAWPLFQAARAEPLATLDDGATAAGLDPYRERAWVLGADGGIRVVDLESGQVLGHHEVEGLHGSVRAVDRTANGDRLTLGTDQGEVWQGRLAWTVGWVQGERQVTLEVTSEAPPDTLSEGETIEVAGALTDDAEVLAAIVRSDRGRTLHVRRVSITTDIFGDSSREGATYRLVPASPPTALAVSPDARRLFVGHEDGSVSVHRLASGEPTEEARFAAAGTPITRLALLIGGRSLVVGAMDGSLQVRAQAERPDGSRRWAELHRLEPHGGPVTALAVSSRGRAFVSGDANGELAWHHATSATTGPFLQGARGGIAALAVSEKGNGVAAVDGTGRVLAWTLDDPHPEATAVTLFTPVWYEGYSEPRYVWQSSAGSDAFEPKLSMVPLVWGTVKGAFWAMAFATPIALLAAIYSAIFLHASLRRRIKPAIEVMATLPSVVLGFLAALWLAPVVERSFPAILSAFVLLPLTLVLAAFGWNALPRRIRGRIPPWAELGLVVGMVLLAVGLASVLGPALESIAFGGDFQHWLQVDRGQTYEQRNAFVVGIAMGFAVVPIIYTLADDALKAVPDSLKSASLACGASRWQTAIRVVVPTAAPGLFSAVMIGLGRAVGETMIVLMATGNTPVLDLFPFTGFRAMSANIAVELPEAPHGGTLYRVLFLTALLLFVMTFVLNTVAEVVRQRLRKRYRAY